MSDRIDDIRAWAASGYGVLARADADEAFEEAVKRAIGDLLAEVDHARAAARAATDAMDALRQTRATAPPEGDGIVRLLSVENAALHEAAGAVARAPLPKRDQAITRLRRVLAGELGEPEFERVNERLRGLVRDLRDAHAALEAADDEVDRTLLGIESSDDSEEDPFDAAVAAHDLAVAARRVTEDKLRDAWAAVNGELDGEVRVDG